MTDSWMFDIPAEPQTPFALIQWKGTDVCLDLPCECGAQLHFDGYFAYHIRCAHCGAVWKLPTRVPLQRMEDGADLSSVCVEDAEDRSNPQTCPAPDTGIT